MYGPLSLFFKFCHHNKTIEQQKYVRSHSSESWCPVDRLPARSSGLSRLTAGFVQSVSTLVGSEQPWLQERAFEADCVSR